MAKITQKQLKRYLQDLSEDELRQEVMRLYSSIPLVKEFYQLELSPDINSLVEDYKKKIRRYYFPAGRSIKRPKAAKMRELIRNFQRISPFPYDVADLLLYQTACMIEFSEENGYISKGFQQTIISRYKEALTLIDKEMLKADFMKPCQQILKNTRFMHWGTYEQLLKLYTDTFNRSKSA
jgi:hypothetical protein